MNCWKLLDYEMEEALWILHTVLLLLLLSEWRKIKMIIRMKKSKETDLMSTF